MPRRFIYGAVGILVLAALYVCWCGTPLIWDGAFQLAISLIRQHPYAYLTRFHTLIIWWPAVWTSRLTDNPWIIQAVYGFPFIIAPAFSVAVSWWIVCKHAPWMIIWPIFGVAAGTLPGQIFIINDSIWQQTLFWPIFLSIFVPLTRPRMVVLAVCVVFQFVHQIGVPLFFGAAVCAAVVALLDRANRRRLLIQSGLMLLLCLLAIAKILITNHIRWLEDTYAEQEFSWPVAVQRYHDGVKGWPLAGLTWMWIAGLFVVIQGHLRDVSLRRFLARAAMAFVLVAGGLWVYWASDGHRWWKALDYRRWILPLTFPFFVYAFVEMCLRTRVQSSATVENVDSSSWLTVRGRLAVILALIFAVILGIQSTIFSRMLHRLVAQVNRSPEVVVPQASVTWLNESPLDHWGTMDAVELLEGKQPRKLLLNEEWIKALYSSPPQVLDQTWYPRPKMYPPPPGPAGWFDYRPFLDQLGRATSESSRPAGAVTKD